MENNGPTGFMGLHWTAAPDPLVIAFAPRSLISTYGRRKINLSQVHLSL